ncbi:hypothetical protein ANCCEY_02190 [Ancylostoma ceylanicum]|uniref:Reverse transcriptase domain-containing protein n=1 Tax=Ancylostoma ceylanicum TaxID=53326 RepID=A0A0D6M895_9BILA|nr:hypothetical protein ANCCEY_02190 [Ancylostoma ceylanicum]
MVIRRLNWKKGIRIDEEHLTHLQFADDLVLLGEDADTVQKMLSELEKEGRKVGLKINRSKTKLMRSECARKKPITLEGEATDKKKMSFERALWQTEAFVKGNTIDIR